MKRPDVLLLGTPPERPKGAPLGSDWVEVLREIPLFAPLPKRHVRRIANLARPHRFAEMTTIVREGQRGETFFVILDGEARLSIRNGKPRVLKAGDWFGELALFDGRPRSATVVARTPLLAMRIARRPFLKLVASDSDLALGLLKGMSERLRAANASAD
jgi:CRP/FNR family transcriptional regulator, cyclic AMP receptor protein